MSTSPLLFNIVFQVLTRTIRQEEEIKNVEIGKKRVKLSLFSDVMILNIEKPKDSTQNLSRILACRILCCGSNRQKHMDHRVLWRKRDGAAALSRGERPDPCLDRLLLLFWAHYIEDGPHLLSTGSL